MNGCMDGWMDGWIKGWMNWCMDGWIDGWTDKLKVGCIDECINGWFYTNVGLWGEPMALLKHASMNGLIKGRITSRQTRHRLRTNKDVAESWRDIGSSTLQKVYDIASSGLFLGMPLIIPKLYHICQLSYVVFFLNLLYLSPLKVACKGNICNFPHSP